MFGLIENYRTGSHIQNGRKRQLKFSIMLNNFKNPSLATILENGGFKFIFNFNLARR